MRTCTKCGLNSNQTHFTPKTTASYCQMCMNQYQKELYVIRTKNLRQISICPICKEIPKKWNLDHNHETKTFNSWLCHNCNRLMGCVNKIETLENAIDYYSLYCS